MRAALQRDAHHCAIPKFGNLRVRLKRKFSGFSYEPSEPSPAGVLDCWIALVWCDLRLVLTEVAWPGGGSSGTGMRQCMHGNGDGR